LGDPPTADEAEAESGPDAPRAPVRELRRQLKRVQRERVLLREELEAIRSSVAWKLLLPLRLLEATATRLRWRLGRRWTPRSDRVARRPDMGGREWLHARRLRPRPFRHSAERPAPEGWLTPVLVDCVGRDGSTLFMRLLASSPNVAVGGDYPYEHRYFTYLWRWSQLVDRAEWPDPLWAKEEMKSLSQEHLALLGPPPWLPRELLEPSEGEEPVSSMSFELAWSELSRRARRATAAGHGGTAEALVRYYAEKHQRTWRVRREDVPAFELVVLLRDPRDVYTSITGLDPVAGFGVRGGRTLDSRLRGQLRGSRERLRWIADLIERDAAPVIRYEELVTDLPGVAGRVASHLSIEVDPDAVAADRRLARRHVTAPDPERSIGRWRSELDPAVAEQFARELGPELRALGFET
jgi:hypothetical protein